MEVTVDLNGKILVDVIKMGHKLVKFMQPGIIEGIISNSESSKIIVYIGSEKVEVAKNGKFIFELKKGIYFVSVRVDGVLIDNIDQFHLDCGEKLFIDITIPYGLLKASDNSSKSGEDVDRIMKLFNEVKVDDKTYHVNSLQLNMLKKIAIFLAIISFVGMFGAINEAEYIAKQLFVVYLLGFIVIFPFWIYKVVKFGNAVSSIVQITDFKIKKMVKMLSDKEKDIFFDKLNKYIFYDEDYKEIVFDAL